MDSMALPTQYIKKPPFVCYFKSSTSKGGAPYKIGDTKAWKGTIFHYCDCPNHRGKIKWYIHPPTERRTRKYWIEKKGGEPIANTSASAIEEDEDNDNAEKTPPLSIFL